MIRYGGQILGELDIGRSCSWNTNKYYRLHNFHVGFKAWDWQQRNPWAHGRHSHFRDCARPLLAKMEFIIVQSTEHDGISSGMITCKNDNHPHSTCWKSGGQWSNGCFWQWRLFGSCCIKQIVLNHDCNCWYSQWLVNVMILLFRGHQCGCHMIVLRLLDGNAWSWLL